MHMELFVSCAGDLATVGRPVVVVPPVRSPPGPFSFLSARPWELESFFSALAIPLRSGRVEFLRGGVGGRTPRVGRQLSGHILGESVSALPVYSFILIPQSDPWTGSPPPLPRNRLVFCFW